MFKAMTCSVVALAALVLLPAGAHAYREEADEYLHSLGAREEADRRRMESEEGGEDQCYRENEHHSGRLETDRDHMEMEEKEKRNGCPHCSDREGGLGY